VRTEEVPLRLDQRRRESLGASPVVVGQRRGEGGRRDAVLGGTGDHSTPGRQAGTDGIGEVIVGEQQGKISITLVGLGDPVQEAGPDDATAPPDPGHRATVDVPAELRAGRGDLIEALGVRDDLRRVQGLTDILDEGVAVLDVPLPGVPGQSGLAGFPLRRQWSLVWRKDLDAGLKKKISDWLFAYGRTGNAEADEKAKKILSDLQWAPFNKSDNNQLLPIRQMELNKTIMKIKGDEKIADAERAAKLAELQKEFDQLGTQIAAMKK